MRLLQPTSPDRSVPWPIPLRRQGRFFVRPDRNNRSIFNGVVKLKRDFRNSKNERGEEGAEVAHGLPGELALWDWLDKDG